MHILTANNSKMVTDEANNVIANKNKVAYSLSIRIFRFGLDPFKGQGHGHIHFDYQYL